MNVKLKCLLRRSVGVSAFGRVFIRLYQSGRLSESVNQESNVLLAVGVSMSSVVDRAKFGVGVLLAIIA